MSAFMSTLRNAAIAVATALLRTGLRLLAPVFPQSHSVLVSAFPATEGNGIETARALVRRYPGEVVWLQDGPVPAEVRELDRLRVVPKASLLGVLAYLRAEAVLFTHGLYGSPPPSRRKPLVNLWHGDGPKDIRPDRRSGSGLIASTYLVGSTRMFSGYQAEAFGVPTERLLLTGNPRTDQFWTPVEETALTRLGITGDFVVWMPTFRERRAIGAVRTARRTGSDGVGEADDLRLLLDGLTDRGLQLVIKPHPIDADRRGWPGAITVTEDDLVAAGVSLYGLLGRSRGLVTDYSSVWVDYLLLDRPMAFLVPDRDSYDRALLPPDVLDWAPGELVGETQPRFGAFFAELDSAGVSGAMLRGAAAARIGLNRSRTAADDLLDELAGRGVIRVGERRSDLGFRNGLSSSR